MLTVYTSERSLIADTKYKIVYSDDKDPKKGISQNDLYQMLAYAVRFEVDEIVLFYPNTIVGDQNYKAQLIIKDKWAEGKEINIKAFQLPILDKGVMTLTVDTKHKLSELFELAKLELKESIERIIL